MKLNLIAPLLLDGYKVDHRRQYPETATLVFSNLTPRGSRVEGVDKVIFFGLQYFLQEYLVDYWKENFFDRDIEEVITEFNQEMLDYVGPNQMGEQHIRDLHALGHLPITFWALPEGSAVNLRVPCFVFWGTDKRFAWITNSLETILSTSTWLAITSATTAVIYRKIFEKWAKQTNSEMLGFVPWQGHDFSFRGHGSFESACLSGAGHLLSFTGTDTVPAIRFAKKYYDATGLIGGSVPATEHSVMCMGGKQDEVETFRRLIEDIYPTGIVSIVSDTWNLWNVVNPDGGICATLKNKILARDGKVVIRPDSGDPVKIVTGYTYQTTDVADTQINIPFDSCERVVCRGVVYEPDHDESNKRQAYRWKKSKNSILEVKGVVQCLYEIFGGTKTKEGYIQLDSHIGAIYGDSITIERAEQICQRLANKGFASTNLVYGIGSFTYQGAITPKAIVTRDTFGFAVKSTYGEVEENGVTIPREIFKDPITDDGLKKSAKGLLAVYEQDGNFVLKDQATWDQVKNCAFEEVWTNGKFVKRQNFAEIRERVAKNF